MITYADLSEVIPTENEPILDRPEIMAHADKLTDIQKIWMENGVVVLQDLLPHDAIDRYVELRLKYDRPGGFGPCPYMFYKEIRDLSLHTHVAQVLESLIGEPMGLHLNLTGFVSTERDIHQDTYLNPEGVNGWYAATWIALDDIHPDSGPFTFYPGSHRWPALRRSKILAHLSPEEAASPNWPNTSERFVTAAIEQKIKDTGVEEMTFNAKKGDVLFWHSRLSHKGAKPKDRSLERRALISHYSGINHRPDMPEKARWNDAWYFVHEKNLDPGAPAPTV